MYQADPETEKREILKRYRNLLNLWKPRHPEDRKNVRKAFKMALEAHKDMRRKSGEPYIYHPLSVATIAAGEIGLGATSIICALLHDVVEDTDYTIEDIRGLFGEKVAGIIDGLTKIKGIFDQHTPSIHAENFKKILLTLSDDVRVILIKLADRLHNMRTLDALSTEKQLKISSETTVLYAPLAHRLGLHAIKSELEDLALKYTEPEVYETIQRMLRESAKGRSRFVNKFIYPVKKDLADKGFRFTIRAREKSIAAIWQKMKKKEIPFEEIYDLFAIRIVIDSALETEKSDCWKVYAAITDHYRPNMERLRDWISIPKANGYEALHTTVMSHTGQWVEIQIRSRRMDEIAEKGYAAHWKYKEAMNLNSQLDNWLDRIKEMIESPDSNALSFIDDVKGYFFLDEISVFTPQGELRTLPANSTVLDFAYAIHSELGDTCIGAKIDKKLAPINQVLRNGQQVELITSRKQSPKEEWIQYVVTTRAKSHIKSVVRDEKKKFTRQGKEKLCQWFHQTGIDCTHENTVKFQSAFHYNTLVDLYFDVARDRLGIKDIRLFAANNLRDGWISFINKNNTKKNRKTVAANNLRETAVPREDFGQQDSLILVQPDFTVASCCNPIPGDEVIGLKISENLPVQIHRTKCPTAQEQISMFGNQPLKLDWTSQTSISYLTHIKVSGMDRIGLISEITRIISSELSLNIQSFHIDAQNGLTQGEINLYVQDTSVLRDCLLKIKNIEGILKVTRID